ncbi:rCG62900 [Rattus norvegicus]|uniref:RCG62900 n=1 Tax=Rattus norvegicus TaxID=10116 RepID=A6K4Y4_RAT|nr:rCG62900 [Rattus norvegicus]
MLRSVSCAEIGLLLTWMSRDMRVLDLRGKSRGAHLVPNQLQVGLAHGPWKDSRLVLFACVCN